MIKFDSALVGLKIQTRVDAVLEAYSRNEAVNWDKVEATVEAAVDQLAELRDKLAMQELLES